MYPHEPDSSNPETDIQFDVPSPGRVKVDVFDVLGRLVSILVDRHLDHSQHAHSWNGKDDDGNAMPNGVYFYRLSFGDRVLVKPLLLLR